VGWVFFLLLAERTNTSQALRVSAAVLSRVRRKVAVNKGPWQGSPGWAGAVRME